MKAMASESDLTSIASDWIARRDRGLTETERAALDRWLSEPANAHAFARCEAAWNAYPSLRDALPPDALARLGTPSRRRGRAPIIAFAATALGAAAALALVLARPAPAAAPTGSTVTRYSAPSNAESRIPLPDGSVAILHRGSRIVYGAFGDTRQVRLTAGEAHFTVAKMPAMPFLVRAGALTIRDIGTAFDVRLDAHRIDVLVTEGAVEVATPADVATGSAPRVLTLGQQATFALGTSAPAPVELNAPPAEAVAEALAWKSRRLTFDRTRLADAIAELNRYNVAQLRLADETLGGTLIAGSVQSDNLEAFVRLLEKGFGIGADRDGSEIRLHTK